MITHLRGTLVQRGATSVVVDVAGVGYAVSVSLQTSEQLPVPEAPVCLLTYLQVREDRMELYGFATAPERELFELLIQVPGIGPRLAQTILSGTDLAELQDAICHGRVNELTRIKGVGRKTAERMVVDLQEKVQQTLQQHAAGAAGPPGGDVAMADEAALALAALGIGVAAARQAVSKAMARAGRVDSVQQLVKLALKER